MHRKKSESDNGVFFAGNHLKKAMFSNGGGFREEILVNKNDTNCLSFHHDFFFISIYTAKGHNPYFSFAPSPSGGGLGWGFES